MFGALLIIASDFSSSLLRSKVREAKLFGGHMVWEQDEESELCFRCCELVFWRKLELEARSMKVRALVWRA